MEKEKNKGFVSKVRSGLARFVFGDEFIAKQTTEYIPDKGRTPNFFKSFYNQYIDAIEKARKRHDKYDRYKFLDDNLAEASASLNIYADNIVSGAMGGRENYMVLLDEATPNKSEIEEVIKYNEQMSNIKNSIWDIARKMLNYGDDWREVVIAQNDKGLKYIDKLKPLPVKEMYAEVDDRGVWKDPLYPYTQKKDERDDGVKFDWWRILHFKVGEEVYGDDYSLFANASQRIGRQLLWIDDCMVIARMSRAWMRYAYLVDTEGLNPEERWEYAQRFLEMMKRTEEAEESTGRLNQYDAPRMPDEDIVIPVTKDSRQDIKPLSGDLNIGNIDDVRYFQGKFLMALNIPKAYMAIEEGVRSKATLQQIDVQFARQVRRKQDALIPGLKKLYKLIFTLAGIDYTSFNWDIVFPELATIDELTRWEMMKIKAEVAKILAVDVGAINNEYIYYEILEMTEEEVNKYRLVTPGREPSDLVNIPPEVAGKLKNDPYVRQMIDDLTDIISWRKAQTDKLEGMKAVGVERNKSLKEMRD